MTFSLQGRNRVRVLKFDYIASKPTTNPLSVYRIRLIAPFHSASWKVVILLLMHFCFTKSVGRPQVVECKFHFVDHGKVAAIAVTV